MPISRLDQATVGRRAARRGTVKPRTKQNGTCVRGRSRKNKQRIKKPNRVKMKNPRGRIKENIDEGREVEKERELASI